MSNDILEPNPFASAIYSNEGNFNAADVYTSVGFALSQWETSETQLGALCTVLMKPKGGNHVAYRAFGGVLASGSRRDMIIAAANAYFSILPNSDLSQSIKRLMGIYSEASRRRDEIAHGVVMGTPLMPNVSTLFFLVPSFYASKKHAPMPSFETTYRFGSKDLDHYAKCFAELGSRAGKIMQAVSMFYASLPGEKQQLLD
jgi:hypothetical protein